MSHHGRLPPDAAGSSRPIGGIRFASKQPLRGLCAARTDSSPAQDKPLLACSDPDAAGGMWVEAYWEFRLVVILRAPKVCPVQLGPGQVSPLEFCSRP